jgi:molecular chaperone HscB
MPTDFLMQQLELREELEAATGGKDSSRLDGLRSRLRLQETKLESEIAEAIDGKKDYAGAAELVRKLMFLERLDAEIDSAYETIEQ